MALVATFVPDLLFGSKVLAAISAAGHQARPVPDAAALRSALEGADGLVVDLTTDAVSRIDAVRVAQPRVPVLAFYSHVEADVREAALAAGFSVVVPRSRMAREGAALVGRLVGDPREAPGRPATP